MIHLEGMAAEFTMDTKIESKFGIYLVIKRSRIFPKYFGKTIILYVDSLMGPENNKYKYTVISASGKEIKILFNHYEALTIDRYILGKALDFLKSEVFELEKESRKILDDPYVRATYIAINNIIDEHVVIENPMPSNVLTTLLHTISDAIYNIRRHIVVDNYKRMELRCSSEEPIIK